VIRNAVRYGPSGSAVVVTAARRDWIQVSVRDHGPGVPEKDLKLIFEPFYRVDAARDRAGGGEGLGLAIAARAIAVHGGTIEAHNVPEGGLEIAMRLPALQRLPTAAKPAAVAA
jgi:two-component system, OmpR family, sensor histidine kinase CpxA